MTIRGRVHPREGLSGGLPITGEPRIDVTVANIAEPTRALTISALVDTGATVHLTLPPPIVAELGLPYWGTWDVMLANDAAAQMEVFAALVSWHGQSRVTPVFAAGDEPLLGMAMLWGSRLTVDAWDGGGVIIEEAAPGPAIRAEYR